MNIQVIDTSNPLWLQTLEKLRYDVYHLPEYVYLESQRTKLLPEAIVIDSGPKIFFLPYLWRRCDDLFDSGLTTAEIFDVVSPYGYPGLLLSSAAASTPEFLNLAIRELTQVLRERQVCSAFLRLHPLLNQGIDRSISSDLVKVTGATVSINLRLSVSEIWNHTRPEHRNKINRCKRQGFTARMVNLQNYIKIFNTIYEETMERVLAPKSYFFGQEYFKNLAEQLGNKLHLCLVELNDEITCVGLFTECCGIVQYHLGGTKTSFLKQAPSKLMFDYVRIWAKERGNEVLHLGGGVGAAKDSLYHFKAGFSKQSHIYQTLRLIVNEKEYYHLVQLRAKALNIGVEEILKTDFFPAYRSPYV